MARFDHKPLADSIPFGAGLPDGRRVRQLDDSPRFRSQVDHAMDELDHGLAQEDAGGQLVPVILDPDYQRGHVWTDAQAALFVGHLLAGGKTAPLILQRYESAANGGKEYWNKPCEMIDGKQRYTACMRWVKGEVTAVLPDGTQVPYACLTQTDRRLLPMVKVAYIDLSRAKRLALYLRLNSGGTPHSDAEISKVRELLEREAKKP